MPRERSCIAIDLKSFYASVECLDRGLDPLDANLVVADESRTDKTICLAVSPSLKALGIPGRPRLFEVVQKARDINAARLIKSPGHCFSGSSCFSHELKRNPSLKLDYIVAMPRMARYIEFSTMVYAVYLKHFAPEDICVYSIDEVFLEATAYLASQKKTARELTCDILAEITRETGLTATAGIGTNLYLAKVAMDIVAKHAEPDKNGARMAELDEMSYRRALWMHEPLTDFWRIGHGYAQRLAQNGMHTMGDVARCSLINQELLYRLFGVNAELLIDHAWGYEPCTMKDIRAYTPQSHSLSQGQVLSAPYPNAAARIIVREMAQELALELVEKRLAAGQIVLTISYDAENLRKSGIFYKGTVVTDGYGRKKPAHAHGSTALEQYTNSASLITAQALALFDAITDKALTVRKITIAAMHVLPEHKAHGREKPCMLSLFSDPEKDREEKLRKEEVLAKERKRQEAVLSIRRKFGKNAIVKGTSFEEKATGRIRNAQIGGHKA